MLTVHFHNSVEDSLLKFAVIIARTEDKYVFCKHKERDTYELPGGHREPGETILETARRELREETGAVDFHIAPVCVYSVREDDGKETFGMLYFALIDTFEELHCEIESILITDRLHERWTYPLIQPVLLEEALRRGYGTTENPYWG